MSEFAGAKHDTVRHRKIEELQRTPRISAEITAAQRAGLVKLRLAELRAFLEASPDWRLIDGASRYRYAATAWWCQTFYVHGEAKVTIHYGNRHGELRHSGTLHDTIVELGNSDEWSMLARFRERTGQLLRGDG